MSSSLGDDGRYLSQGVHDRETVQRAYHDPRSQRAIHARELETGPRLITFCDMVQWPLLSGISGSRWSPRLVHSYPWGFGRSFCERGFHPDFPSHFVHGRRCERLANV